MLKQRCSRLLVCATHPVQYQCPLWRRVAHDPRISLKVLFLSDFSVRGYRDTEFGVDVRWGSPLLEGFEHDFLGHASHHSSWSVGPLGLRRRMGAFAPDAVLINGYVPLFYWRAAAVARGLGARVLYRGEATDVAVARGSLKARMRTLLLKRFYQNVDLCLAIGANARRHYERIGIPAERIGWSPYCVDSDHFEAQVARWMPERDAVRLELGIPPEALCVLFSGKLIPKKEPATLIRAANAMAGTDSPPVVVLFMGDGHLRGELEQLAASLGVTTRFVGFQSQDLVGRFFAASDLLVLPSVFGETWGLVVNEALQVGLPVVVSDRVGCGPDLVREGETGCVFPAGDVPALAAGLSATAAMLRQDGRDVVRERCRHVVAEYSLAEAARGIVDAVINE